MPETTPIVEHAGTGYKLPEPLAREIDDLSKGLPAGLKYTRLAKTADIDELDDENRTDVSFITTDSVDRDGEVVLPEGLDTKGYNGVVTFCHRYDQLPVGKNLWIKPKMKGPRNGLIAKTYYHTKPKDWEGPWLPSAILHLMQSPHPTCTGKSIGFIPMEIRNATAEEKARRPELKDVPIISRARIIEYAVTGVPANSDAEMEAVAKALKEGTLTKELASMIGLKDMADGDGAGTCSMPPCPKCLSAEHVVSLSSAPGMSDLPTHYCHKCMKAFREGDAKAHEDAATKAEADKKAAIEAALAAPFVRADVYLEQQRKEAQRAAKDRISDYLTARLGTV